MTELVTAKPRKAPILLNISTQSVQLFRNVVMLTAQLSQEGLIQVCTDGLTIHAQDMSQVSFWSAHLSHRLFKGYEVKDRFTLGQSFRELKTVFFAVTTQTAEQLTIAYDSRKQHVSYDLCGSDKTLERLNVIDLRSVPGGEPQVDYETYVLLKCETLAGIIKKHSLCAPLIKIDILFDRVIFMTSNEHRVCTSTLQSKRSEEDDHPFAKGAKGPGSHAPPRAKRKPASSDKAPASLKKPKNDPKPVLPQQPNAQEDGYDTEDEKDEPNEEENGESSSTNTESKSSRSLSGSPHGREEKQDTIGGLRQDDYEEDDSAWDIKVRCQSPVTQYFTMSHLQTLTTACRGKNKLSESIRLCMKKGQPLLAEFITDPEVASLRYHISCKIME